MPRVTVPVGTGFVGAAPVPCLLQDVARAATALRKLTDPCNEASATNSSGRRFTLARGDVSDGEFADYMVGDRYVALHSAGHCNDSTRMRLRSMTSGQILEISVVRQTSRDRAGAIRDSALLSGCHPTVLP